MSLGVCRTMSSGSSGHKVTVPEALCSILFLMSFMLLRCLVREIGVQATVPIQGLQTRYHQGYHGIL